jgi:hypothetical protein
MALNILLIPAMSADPERLLSGVKITISDRRTCPGIYTIKALESLKSWLKIEAFMDDDKEDILLQKEVIQESSGEEVIQLN